MGIAFGLAAALLWGGGDLLINRLTVLIGTTRALVITQIFSLLCWLGLGAVVGFPSHATSQLWGTAILCGVFHVAGLALTYRAFEIGTLSVVSPIASSFAIVTAVLALIAGERPGVLAIGGALMLIVGMVFVTRSASDGEGGSLKGVPEALGSALGFGVMFWMIDRVTPSLGYAAPLIVLKIMATLFAVVSVAIKGKKEALVEWSGRMRRDVVLLGLGIAISDSLAWAAWIKGTQTSYASVVTALASLFSAVTVVLAALILKERLTRSQLIGVVVIFVGILMVSL